MLWAAVIFGLLSLGSTQDIRNHVCASEGSKNACQQLARSQKLSCEYNLHNVDCMLNIQNEKAHLGRISGEEAAIGANLLYNDVIVLGEVKSFFAPSQTVVLVKNSIPSNFNDLKGKKLCHPGYKHDTAFSRLFLQELEVKVADGDTQFCSEKNTTLTEKHVKSLAGFFGESCRPGPWTQDENLDSILKEKYQSLCTLCGTDKCDTDYKAPFGDALKCLVDKDADVAVSTLFEAKKFFNNSQTNRANYKFLCKDGSSKSWNAACTWSSELPGLIIAKRNSVKEIRSFLEDNLKSKLDGVTGTSSNAVYEQALVDILDLRRGETVQLQSANSYDSLLDYVKELRTIPTVESSRKCNIDLKWCTYSEGEQSKCQWLSQAGLNEGIQPVVRCLRSEEDTELSCLNDVQKGKSDIVVASANFGYISLKKDLVAIAYPETDSRNLSVILTVVKDGTTLTKFKDKQACIPEYGGKEFMAFIDVAKIQKAIDGASCDYGKLLSDYVGDSCVPGARDFQRGSSDSINADKLCANCIPINTTATERYCNDDVINKYYGSTGAVKCLDDGKGDFAVISKMEIPTDVVNTTNLRVVCKNGTLARYPGLDVDKDCALNVITSSEVVTRADNSKNPDIRLALQEFERRFGQDLKKPFHLFDVFNGTLDLLFKDSTPGLNFDGNTEYIKNYKRMLENCKECKADPGSGASISASVLLICALLSVYRYF